jgi:hypothetical protein
MKMTNPYTKDAIVAHMILWFLHVYEDPAENTPYESAEGGYQYIYGDPVEAREALEDEFGGMIAEELISNAAERLEEDHNVDGWVPKPTEDFYK